MGQHPVRGILAPTRAIKSRAKVKNIFCLNSGIFKQFVNAESMKLTIYLDIVPPAASIFFADFEI
jgi:hypothetical protein